MVKIGLYLETQDWGGKDWFVSLENEKGHKIEELFMQPEYSCFGKVLNLESDAPDTYSQVRLFKDVDSQDFYSISYDESKDNSYDADSVAAFFDIEIDEDGDAVATLKEDIQNQIINKMDMQMFRFYAGKDEKPQSDNIGREISLARAKNFLAKFPFIVAYNPYGHVSTDTMGWEFNCFDTLKEAQDFADEYDYSGTEQISVWDESDYEEVSRFLDNRRIQFGNINNDAVSYIW